MGKETVKFSREWAMPCSDTFCIKPIGEFVIRYAEKAVISVDPFARNNKIATYTNDLSPHTSAQFHMDAEEFLQMLSAFGVKCDLLIFDPPYSPRQISECYKAAGITVGMKDTQNAALYKRVKDAALPLLTESAIALSFGWNSAGIGKGNGFRIIEIMNVCHGAAHNDTICIAEQRL